MVLWFLGSVGGLVLSGARGSVPAARAMHTAGARLGLATLLKSWPHENPKP